MSERCITFEGSRVVGIRSLDPGEPVHGQVSTKTLCTGVSTGTETRVLRGKQVGAEFPLIPGYENVGRVEKAGPRTSVAPGTLVIVPSHAYNSSGINKTWGAQVSRSITSADSVIPVPEGVRPEDAIYAKVGGIALHGVRRAAVGEGDWIAVVGLGIIGHLVVQHALARGARVVAIDMDESRVALAQKAGADHALQASDSRLQERVEELTGGGVSAAFDATGRADTLAGTAALIRSRPWHHPELNCGTLVVQGSLEAPMCLDYNQLFAQELDVMVPRDCDLSDMSETLALIAADKVRPSIIPAERYTPDRAQEAYDRLLARKTMRVLFDWNS
jgi:2-desacetyl-2-hydroxyethyl bacteriochlorophyllide A dehydrogenase